MSDRRRTAKDLAERDRTKVIPGHTAYGQQSDHEANYTNPHEVEMSQLEDVSFTGLLTGQTQEYNAGTGLWHNVNIPRKTQNRAYFFSSF